MFIFPLRHNNMKSLVPRILSKQALPPILFFLLFFLMLSESEAVFRGAAKGLLHWYRTVLPTLFPFLFICTLLIQTNAIRYLARLIPGIFCRFFGVSKNGILAVLTGFFCGYPMGAKVTADLYRANKITKQEGAYLLSFCNNTSPAFILGYIIHQYLQEPRLFIPTLSILFLTPILLSFLFRKIYTRHPFPPLNTMPASAANPTHTMPLPQSLDFSLSNAMETIAKIGGYIILFCVLIELVSLLPFHFAWVKYLFIPNLEITNGIALIWGMRISFSAHYILCIFCTAFGGWCAVLQTMSVIQGTGFPIFPYVIEKLATAAAASLFAYLYLKLFF